MKIRKEWETIRRQVAIGGWVTDGSGQGMKKLSVQIIAMPDIFAMRLSSGSAEPLRRGQDSETSPDRTTTRNNGGFYFLDLPAGHYTLKVIDPVSGLQDEKQASVVWDKNGKVNKVLMIMRLH